MENINGLKQWKVSKKKKKNKKKNKKMSKLSLSDELDRLLEENKNLKREVNIPKVGMVQNLESDSLSTKIKEYDALLQVNVDLKEHVIKLRNQIKDLKVELNNLKEEYAL